MTDSEFYERVCRLAKLKLQDIRPGGLVNAEWEMHPVDYSRFYTELVNRTNSHESMKTLWGVRISWDESVPKGELRLVLREKIYDGVHRRSPVLRCDNWDTASSVVGGLELPRGR